MNIEIDQQKTIRIVDPNRDDYARFAAAMQENHRGLHYFADASTALQFGRYQSAVMWIVRLELPDMTGFDLLKLVRGRFRRTPVCLVGQTYDPDDEQQALCSGATMYASKPLDVANLVRLARHLGMSDRGVSSLCQATPTSVSRETLGRPEPCSNPSQFESFRLGEQPGWRRGPPRI